MYYFREYHLPAVVARAFNHTGPRRGPAIRPPCNARASAADLERFSPELAARDRWLVLNKLDLVAPDARAAHCDALVERLGYTGPVYHISALSGEGCQELCQAIMNYLEDKP